VKLQFKKRRLIPVALAILVLVVGSGVAYAFWTAGGTGTGAANAAPGVTVTVNQTTVLNPMYPGLAAQTIGGDFTNATGAPVLVTSITATISSVILADGTTVGTAATCSAADFTLAPTAAVGAQIPIGDHVGAWGNTVLPAPGVVTMTIMFNNTASNQDACKNATVHLSYLAS
jgi:hypothetical protein